MVQVNPSSSVFSVAVNSTNAANQVGVGRSQSYYDGLAREWAISPNIVQNEDYSSKYYAGKSQEYADSILQDAGFIAVSQDLTNIDTVAGSILNVNAVATDISNVNAVYTDLSNIDSVAGDLINIDNVAGDLTNINAVNSNKTNIDTVADSISNVNAVATNISNVNAVYADLTNVDTVAGSITNVNNVGGSIANVNTVATNVSDINTCSTNISDINTCAANISTIGNKVSKTGDNMSGDLSIINSNPRFNGMNLTVDYEDTTTPQNVKYFINLTGTDKYAKLTGSFFNEFNTDNNFVTGFNVRRKINGTEKEGVFCAGVDSTGDDFAYASSGVKQTITNWAFPSTNQTIPIVMQASGATYTSPCDGWFGCRLQGSAAGSANVYNLTADPNGHFLAIFAFYNAGEWRGGYMPVKKGDVVMFEYFNLYFITGDMFWLPAVGG